MLIDVEEEAEKSLT